LIGFAQSRLTPRLPKRPGFCTIGSE
jgi:hypothetical protein